MSKEAYKAFGKKISEDQALKQKFKEVGPENLAGVIALAKENGFDVTEADFLAAAKELDASKELSDADLEKVAGGNAAAVGAVVAVSMAAAAHWI
ncbi:MAG TPA: Nif11-like leader peptide family natural product precursor [Negativicutes bacterium]|nr:Nif11-like leader peptide family natural product precursor [Negativicutes bacterium]